MTKAKYISDGAAWDPGHTRRALVIRRDQFLPKAE